MAAVIHANFRFDPAGLKEKCGLEPGGIVQKTVDKSVIDWNLQYVPAQTLTLGRSAYSATDIGSGTVVYPGPYARYQYYGQVMGPNIPIFEDSSGEPTGFFSPPGQKKHLTGEALTYSKDVNPLAGAYWFERMKADHAQDIIKEAQDVANGK
jgi:hypothetical protein